MYSGKEILCETTSGLAINFVKSGIMFSSNTSGTIQDSVKSMLGINSPIDHERYLELPSLIWLILCGYDLFGLLDGSLTAPTSLSIRSYVNKIPSLCALLAASGSQISEAERTAVLFASLLSEFDAIVSSASLSSGPL
ncbi:hypothetical protein PVK06_026705 [Gossypium arboreum]|uniref:Uncharacterized protein n=1 Tax=Gossypium arboreum TaxID=29729 RepID=A0ABR0P1V4_GOSAR|nr:hypothetical protein PVK06_026705 [Gossypium arboreum]